MNCNPAGEWFVKQNLEVSLKKGEVLQDGKYAGFEMVCPYCGAYTIDTLSDDVECGICGGSFND